MLTIDPRALACAVLIVVAPIGALDARPNSAILDRGILTQASEIGVTRLDVASAELDIRYADGRVYRDGIPPERRGSMAALLQTPFWILGGTMTAQTAVCADEGRNGADALNLVSRGCAGGQSALCADAREMLGSALAALNDCLSAASPGDDGAAESQNEAP